MNDLPAIQQVSPPSIGRIVHYVARGSADGVFPPVDRVAVVTEVGTDDPYAAGLCVLNPTGLFFHPLQAGGCRYDEARSPGSWHWPPRVGA